MLRARRIAAAALAAVLLGTPSPGRGAAARTPAADRVEAQNLDFLIYDPSNTTLVGRGHYTVAVTRDVVTIDGRSDFLDGEHDAESERLRATGADPQLVSYEHSFFDAQGAPQRVARLDAPSARATCVSYSGGQSRLVSKVLRIPANTYAGASVLIPIADQLKRNSSGELDFHVFDCASGPRVFALRVDLQQASWSYLPHDGGLVKADARPVFGWFDVFLKPFVPETRLWFDPRHDFGFMGGMLARYYRGPEVMLVRIPPTLAAPPLSDGKPQAAAISSGLVAAAPSATPAAP